MIGVFANPHAPSAGPAASVAEWRSHFGAWAINSSPLVLSVWAKPLLNDRLAVLAVSMQRTGSVDAALNLTAIDPALPCLQKGCAAGHKETADEAEAAVSHTLVAPV